MIGLEKHQEGRIGLYKKPQNRTNNNRKPQNQNKFRSKPKTASKIRKGVHAVEVVVAPIRELKHATFLSHGRQPEVCCFPI